MTPYRAPAPPATPYAGRVAAGPVESGRTPGGRPGPLTGTGRRPSEAAPAAGQVAGPSRGRHDRARRYAAHPGGVTTTASDAPAARPAPTPTGAGR